MAKAKTSSKTAKKTTRSESSKKASPRSTSRKTAKTASGKASDAKRPVVKAQKTKTKSAANSAAGRKRKSAEKVTVERRAAHSERRKNTERRKTEEPVAVERRAIERRAKVNRRRQIDPTTCERDYTNEELEFMSALDDYKRSSGRMFPTCSEVLEVIKSLGYEKRTAPDCVIDEQITENSSQLDADQASVQSDVDYASRDSVWHSGQSADLLPQNNMLANSQGDVSGDYGSLIKTGDCEAPADQEIDHVHSHFPIDMDECDCSERVIF